MAFTGWRAGQRITAAGLNSMVSPWQDYTVVWTSDTGGTTTLGAGFLGGRYARMGDTIAFDIRLQWGTGTASTGTGWHLSLPTAVSTTLGGTSSPCMGWILDSSANTRYLAGAYCDTTTTPGTAAAIVVHGTSDFIDQAAPFTWATGDRLNLFGTYEAA